MQNEHHIFQNILIATFLPAAFAGNMAFAGPTLIEQTLEAIQHCMTQSPAPWPDEWKREYIETIYQTVESHRDAPHFDNRLEILREGFSSCWKGNDAGSALRIVINFLAFFEFY